MKKTAVILVLFLVFGSFALPVIAQVSLGTATPVRITEKGVQDGDIISTREGGTYIRSNTAYDPFLYGIVTLDPALYIYDKAAKDELPAVNSGKIYVRVSTAKGEIKRGDGITSSDNPGIGVRATDNGFIIGYAEEGYSAKDPKQVGKILASIDPHFAQINGNLFNSLFSLPRLTFSATPLNAIRYLIAGLIGVLSFYIGFRFFGRASLKGVESIGRNPLAKRAIILIVVINSALTFGVMLIGLAVAYLILII